MSFEQLQNYCALLEKQSNLLEKQRALFEQQCTLLQDHSTSLEKQNAELTVKLNWFMEQFRKSKHQQFGASSEKTSDERQLFLFNEAESEAQPLLTEPTIETITYNRKKHQGQREKRPAG